jgi:prophage DNA circulation protein
MTWREQQRKVTFPDGRELVGASFRGIPFFVSSGTQTGGRRTVTHEFPRRNDPQVDDLGRATKTFSIDGYVLGADYMTQRDALIDALDDVEGPGELVHPFYGTISVQAGPFSTTETTAQGGIAVFTIEFTRVAQTPPAAVESPDLQGELDESATAARAASETEITDNYDVSGQPSWALESLSTDVLAAMAGWRTYLQPLVQAEQAAARLAADIELIEGTASSLIREPVELLDALRDALASVVESAVVAPLEFAKALIETYEAIGLVQLAPTTTSTSTQERNNQLALSAAMKREMLVYACQLAGLAAYPSLEDAIDIRDQLVDLLDEQSQAASVEIYPELSEVRAKLTAAVPGTAQLARLQTVSRKVETPAILLSYQLYGTTSESEDIVERNGAADPLFLSGDLEVLSRAG